VTGTAVTRAIGGLGADNNSGSGVDGAANTGNGASPSAQNIRNSSGGSGVVFLKYPSAYTITIGAGLTGTTATVGANKVTTITQGTGNVSWAA
jgi:hypothetical protein